MKNKQLIATVLEGIRKVPIRIYLTPNDDLICSCFRFQPIRNFSSKLAPEQPCCIHVSALYGPIGYAVITFTPLGRDQFDWRLAAIKLQASAR